MIDFIMDQPNQILWETKQFLEEIKVIELSFSHLEATWIPRNCNFLALNIAVWSFNELKERSFNVVDIPYFV